MHHWGLAGPAGILASVCATCLRFGSRGRKAQEEKPAELGTLAHGEGCRAE